MVADVIDVHNKNFDSKKGEFIHPDYFSNAVSRDAKFEILSTVAAKKCIIQRKNDLVGHKRLIYAIDKSDKTMEATRKITTDFMIKHLGFTNDDIIFIDRTEFGVDKDGVWHTKFSAET